jgi:hypothetical protein
VGRRRKSGQEASTHRCGAGGELGEGQKGAKRRDDGEAERRRSTGLSARCSGCVSARGWRRVGQEALVGCSGADGARDCGCGAAEVADGGEKRLRRRSGGGAERRRRRGAKMRACERIKEVEEGSWTRCETKKRHGRAGAAAGGWRHTWRLRATAARHGRAGKSQWGSGERRAGE